MDLSTVQKIVIWALPLIFAITVHEVAHGWVASYFGDQTARFAGRLTLNPAKHIDPVGTLLVPMVMLMMSNFIFGWAKPVPVDPRNMRNPRRDMVIVALAGPLSNVIMAFLWGAIARWGVALEAGGNTWLGLPLIYMGGAGIMINVVLAVLNLIPLPPLDGSKLLAGVLRGKAAYYFHMLEPYSFLIILALLFTGVLFAIMGPPVYFLINWIGGFYGLA